MRRRRAGVRSAACWLVCGAGLFGACSGPVPEASPAPGATGWPLVLSMDFDVPASLAGLAFSDPKAWSWSPDDGGSLELAGSAAYQPPHRSPLAIALVRELWLTDFVLEAEIRSTVAEYPHRDLCLFFGFQAPGELRYVHLASTPDEHAHNVFAVHEAPRAALAPLASRGVSWGEDVWHRARLERAGGTIRVWLDGELVLSAEDPDPRTGRVGLGSFDDTGRFRALRVYAPERSSPPVDDVFAR